METQSTKMTKKEKFNVRRFPQKLEGSTAGRLPMFFEQEVIQMLYKIEHKETQKNQKMSQSPLWC